MDQEMKSSAFQIVNFVLNIALWQTENRGYFHKMSLHIQDVVPGFIINWIIVDNGVLSFEGLVKDKYGQYVKETRLAEDMELDHVKAILKLIKGINLFA